MQPVNPGASSVAAISFFTGTYDETLALVRRARDYLMYAGMGQGFGQQGFGQSTTGGQDALPRLILARETCRMTSRLTRTLAWILAVRAAHCGEITLDEALGDECDLSRDPTCNARPDDLDNLPAGWQRLFDDSDKLYRRVSRLREVVRRDAAQKQV